MSRDPISEQGGLNQYSIVQNRPTDWTDKLGKRTNDPGGNCHLEQYLYCESWKKRWEVDGYSSAKCCRKFMFESTFNREATYQMAGTSAVGGGALLIVGGGAASGAATIVGSFLIVPAVHMAAALYCDSDVCTQWQVRTRLVCSYPPDQFE